MGDILGVYTAGRAGGPMQPLAEAVLEAGRGIVGDRYHAGAGEFSRKLEADGRGDWQLTLIESEEIDVFVRAQGLAFHHGDFRRNVVTRGVRLNALAGQCFLLDGVLIEGIRLCEPCAHLARLLTPQLLPAMVGRCGLRARVLGSGVIRPGGAVDVAADGDGASDRYA